MTDFQPRKGLALVAFTKQHTPEVQPKNGLLLPSKPAEETLVRGQIILADDPDNYFRDGDMVVVAPADIIGEFNSDAGASFLINTKDILGKVVGQ